MVMVAKVAIKGATLPLVITRPFTAPKTAPMTQASTMPTMGLLPLLIKLPIRTELSAKILPTDKSMPPVKITKVMPKEIRALIET